MGLGELLDRIRDLYTEQLASAVAELEQQSGTEVLSDVALRNKEGEVVGEGVLGLPLRVDLAVLSADAEARTISIDSERVLSFEALSFTWSDGVRVILHPFAWDNLIARFPVPVAKTDWQPLVAWFYEWFREEEDGNGEPLGVIHFLSDPEVSGGSVRFSTDLGSAPVEAFEGFLDAIAALDVREVVIGGET